tara:strand:- start:606 stop:833 length:228 start_codon:yes stop_codon:yes gene_type:complete
LLIAKKIGETQMTTKYTETETEVFAFLDRLRESGITNMWGASPYIREMFPEIQRYEANRLLVKWMETFEERHPND